MLAGTERFTPLSAERLNHAVASGHVVNLSRTEAFVYRCS